MKTNTIEIPKRRFAILIAGFLLTLGSTLFFGYYSYLMFNRSDAYEKLADANYELAQRHLKLAQDSEVRAMDEAAKALIEKRKADEAMRIAQEAQEALAKCKGR